MAKRDVKGLHRVVSKGRVYWYAWRERGAPRLRGQYGTPEFWASYDEAVRERRIPEPGRFRSLVTLYPRGEHGLPKACGLHQEELGALAG